MSKKDFAKDEVDYVVGKDIPENWKTWQQIYVKAPKGQSLRKFCVEHDLNYHTAKKYLFFADKQKYHANLKETFSDSLSQLAESQVVKTLPTDTLLTENLPDLDISSS